MEYSFWLLNISLFLLCFCFFLFLFLPFNFLHRIHHRIIVYNLNFTIINHMVGIELLSIMGLAKYFFIWTKQRKSKWWASIVRSLSKNIAVRLRKPTVAYDTLIGSNLIWEFKHVAYITLVWDQTMKKNTGYYFSWLIMEKHVWTNVLIH